MTMVGLGINGIETCLDAARDAIVERRDVPAGTKERFLEIEVTVAQSGEVVVQQRFCMLPREVMGVVHNTFDMQSVSDENPISEDDIRYAVAQEIGSDFAANVECWNDLAQHAEHEAEVAELRWK